MDLSTNGKRFQEVRVGLCERGGWNLAKCPLDQVACVDPNSSCSLFSLSWYHGSLNSCGRERPKCTKANKGRLKVNCNPRKGIRGLYICCSCCCLFFPLSCLNYISFPQWFELNFVSCFQMDVLGAKKIRTKIQGSQIR